MSRDKHTEDFRGRDACDALVLVYFAFGSTGLGPPTLFLKVIPLVEYKRLQNWGSISKNRLSVRSLDTAVLTVLFMDLLIAVT